MEWEEETKELVALLKEKGWHISTAESCTAGMVAAAVVDVPGASEVFEEGYITYSDRIKKKLLGVPEKVLQKYTAVSSQTAEKMAEGARMASGAELTVAVTGYAGPGAAEDGTPAGTVYIGVCSKGQPRVKKFLFDGSRKQIREKAAKEAIRFALETLR